MRVLWTLAVRALAIRSRVNHPRESIATYPARRHRWPRPSLNDPPYAAHSLNRLLSHRRTGGWNIDWPQI